MKQLIAVVAQQGRSTEAGLRHTAVIVPPLVSKQINIGAEIEELVEKSIQIFGCNTQRREKRVCSRFVCLSFLPLIWTLQVMLSDTGCAQIEFFSLILFDLWVAFSPNSLSDPWDKMLW